MPKTNYYSFGNSASRDAYNKVYTPGDQPSPRGRDMKDMPGPGEYKYKNMNVGVDARKFSFLKRTKNVYGKSSLNITKKLTTMVISFFMLLTLRTCFRTREYYEKGQRARTWYLCTSYRDKFHWQISFVYHTVSGRTFHR